ncbi:hypothetical protein FISHEDRAFT_78275 [Fistulina hepatica ATCC 64428]|nr:hypothetical protein FISHEDRAFT_78275 [Fistulina hepatica ATCC 64428]
MASNRNRPAKSLSSMPTLSQVAAAASAQKPPTFYTHRLNISLDQAASASSSPSNSTLPSTLLSLASHVYSRGESMLDVVANAAECSHACAHDHDHDSDPDNEDEEDDLLTSYASFFQRLRQAPQQAPLNNMSTTMPAPAEDGVKRVRLPKPKMPMQGEPGTRFFRYPFNYDLMPDIARDSLNFATFQLHYLEDWFLDPSDFAQEDVEFDPPKPPFPPSLQPPWKWQEIMSASGYQCGTGELVLRCLFCRKVYRGVNAKSMLTRHLKKHKINVGKDKENKEPVEPHDDAIVASQESLLAVEVSSQGDPPGSSTTHSSCLQLGTTDDVPPVPTKRGGPVSHASQSTSRKRSYGALARSRARRVSEASSSTTKARSVSNKDAPTSFAGKRNLRDRVCVPPRSVSPVSASSDSDDEADNGEPKASGEHNEDEDSSTAVSSLMQAPQTPSHPQLVPSSPMRFFPPSASRSPSWHQGPLLSSALGRDLLPDQYSTPGSRFRKRNKLSSPALFSPNIRGLLTPNMRRLAGRSFTTPSNWMPRTDPSDDGDKLGTPFSPVKGSTQSDFDRECELLVRSQSDFMTEIMSFGSEPPQFRLTSQLDMSDYTTPGHSRAGSTSSNMGLTSSAHTSASDDSHSSMRYPNGIGLLAASPILATMSNKGAKVDIDDPDDVELQADSPRKRRRVGS